MTSVSTLWDASPHMLYCGTYRTRWSLYYGSGVPDCVKMWSSLHRSNVTKQQAMFKFDTCGLERRPQCQCAKRVRTLFVCNFMFFMNTESRSAKLWLRLVYFTGPKNVNGLCVQLLKPILLWWTRKNESRGQKGKEWVGSKASFSGLDLSVPGLFWASKTQTAHTCSAPLPFTEHHEQNSTEAQATQKPLICLLGCWRIDANELVSWPSLALCLPLFLSLQKDIIYQLVTLFPQWPALNQ